MSEKVSEKVTAASEKVSAKIEKLSTVTAAEVAPSLPVPKKDLSKYLGQWWAKKRGGLWIVTRRTLSTILF